VLDKEQKQIFPESEEAHRRVDLLTKVWLLDGTEQWILIHVEIQGYRDEDFPIRMFVYFYRLTDRFKVPVSALALLTDKDKAWRPDKYEFTCMKTRLVYQYPVYKLSDFSEADFQGGSNPWSWVMKTALIGLKSNWDDESLLKMKVQLYRDFRKMGHSVEKVRLFLQFLKYHVRFEKTEFYSKFDHQIQSVDNKKESPMGIIELVKEHLIEEAKQEGIEKGIEKGIEQGMEKGIEQGDAARSRKVITNIILKHPDWADEMIAELVEVPLNFVKVIRKEMTQENK
jgi:hypothetical protein